jgi:hypothetical protein
MVALRTKFDGQRIEVPAELRGEAPGDVLVIYLENEPPNEAASGRLSFWEAVGKVEHPRTAADIDAQIQAERDSWGGR